jgi:hypothetical protein
VAKPSVPLVMILYSQFGITNEKEFHPSQITGLKPSKKGRAQWLFLVS